METESSAVANIVLFFLFFFDTLTMDTDSTDQDSGLHLLPTKQAKTTDWNKCIICQLHTKETVSSATSAGITKFHDAM